MVIVKNDGEGARRRGRPPAFDRQIVLKEAAVTFWRHGYEGSSIADLTKAMGITPQSLYAAFGSKEQLYREALDWYQRELGTQMIHELESAPDIAIGLANVLRVSAVNFATSDSPKGCMISTALLNHASEHEAVAATVSAHRTATLDKIRLCLSEARKRGHVRPDTNVDGVARFVGAVIQGLSVQAIDGATPQELNTLVDVAVCTLQHTLGANAD